jgi:hypothetical protein
MPFQMFQVVTQNPNDVTGGGGCVCDPQKQIDCRPPYAVFPGNDMENVASPHVVMCLACAMSVVDACMGEALAGGETGFLPNLDDEDDVPEV